MHYMLCISKVTISLIKTMPAFMTVRSVKKNKNSEGNTLIVEFFF